MTQEKMKDKVIWWENIVAEGEKGASIIQVLVEHRNKAGEWKQEVGRG